ncbi:MAG: hypothetical protein ACFFD2_10495 [Promethearchaeota archaeon]
MKIQKLEKRNIHIPIDTPQADGSCGLIDKNEYEENQVLWDLKNFSNISNVNKLLIKGIRNLREHLYILNMGGYSLTHTIPNHKLFKCKFISNLKEEIFSA